MKSTKKASKLVSTKEMPNPTDRVTLGGGGFSMVGPGTSIKNQTTDYGKKKGK